MYTNRPPRARHSHRPLEFNLPAFEEDPKLDYLDSVFATLMSSRFGNGATYVLNPRIETRAADESFDFLDLLHGAGIGWHETESVGRKILGRAERLLRRRSTGRVLPGQNPARSKGTLSVHSTLGRDQAAFAMSPSNLARGSP